MKKTVLKISVLIAGLIFVFTSASWADSGKNGYRKYGVKKQIHSKHNGGGSLHRPAHYKPNVIRHHKPFYYKQHGHHRRPAHYRHHNFYHRKRWIQKHRQYLRHKWIHHHRRHYSDNSYGDDAAEAYNEFSIAATISEPGVEFTIGTKRTW